MDKTKKLGGSVHDVGGRAAHVALLGLLAVTVACGTPSPGGDPVSDIGDEVDPVAAGNEGAAPSGETAMNQRAMDHSAMDHGDMDHEEAGDEAEPGSAAVPFAEQVFGANSGDYGIAIAPDGRTIFFTRAMPAAGNEAVYFTRLVAGQWTEPDVAPFSGRFHDKEPYVSPDGNRVFFASRRPARGRVERPDFDIWYAERSGESWEDWSDPVRVEAVNSEYNDDYPAVAGDGTIAFARDDDSGNVNLWIAYGSPGGPGNARPFGRPINTVYAEADPWIAPDGRFIIFSSPQIGPDAQGQGDLYVIHRRGGAWTRPASLGAGVNSIAHEYGPAMSPDGTTLYFSRGFGGRVWMVPVSGLDNLNGSATP